MLFSSLAFYSASPCADASLYLLQLMVKFTWGVAACSAALLMFVFIPVSWGTSFYNNEGMVETLHSEL